MKPVPLKVCLAQYIKESLAMNPKNTDLPDEIVMNFLLALQNYNLDDALRDFEHVTMDSKT